MVEVVVEVLVDTSEEPDADATDPKATSTAATSARRCIMRVSFALQGIMKDLDGLEQV